MTRTPLPVLLAVVLAAVFLRCAIAASEQGLSPQQLVRACVQNEIQASTSAPTHLMFKDYRKTAHLSQVKLLVETRDATAGMLVAQNGQPLNEQQQKAEEARLDNYVRNPEELNRKRKQEKEDADRTERIMKALPDAFLYEIDGAAKGSTSIGVPGQDLVRLSFRPNPAYSPPTRVEQVLTAMAGHILIDDKNKRIAEIDGTLQRDVGFGWGILGHLDQGGRFLVQQAEVTDHTWDVTRMELAFTGKILLFKKLNIQSTDVFSDFRLVPTNLTFAQGVDLLKKEAAQNQAASGSQSKSHEKAAAHEAKDEAESLCCDH